MNYFGGLYAMKISEIEERMILLLKLLSLPSKIQVTDSKVSLL